MNIPKIKMNLPNLLTKKPSEYPKMLVWDYDSKSKVERIVIGHFFNQIVSVNIHYEAKFLEGDSLHTQSYKNAEEIPKEIPLTFEEIESALLGRVVEGDEEGIKGTLGSQMYTNNQLEIYLISGREVERVSKFLTDKKEWLDVTRENLEKEGLL